MATNAKKYAANLLTQHGALFEVCMSSNVRKILSWATGRTGRYTLAIYEANHDVGKYEQIDYVEYKNGRRVRGSGQIR